MDVNLAESVASLRRVEAPIAPGRTRRFEGGRKRLVVVGVMIVSLVGAAVVYKRSTGRAMHDYESGPVRTESDTTTSIRVEVGQVVTFGGIILESFSKKPAVLESLRFDPPLDSGMTLVDVKVAGKGRGIGMVGTDRGFPPSGMPPEALRPLPGAIVPPKHVDPEWGVEVLMGFKLDKPGQFGFHHALIDYRIGGKRHRIRVNDGFLICGGPDYPRCDSEAFRKLRDD